MNRLCKLRHLHLPGLTPYLRASAIQDYLVRTHLDHKAAQSSSPPPGPVLLTFQTPPTYTCGRREVGTLSDSQIAHLRAGGTAEFYEALRGGQTTFHGPGQLTAYLTLSLQQHGLNTRTHVKLLEDSVIGTCEYYGLSTHTTENPGVWIGSQPDDQKIASVGVHLRRHIASHGIGLNVSVDLSWFDRIVACGLVGKRATNLEKEWTAHYGGAEQQMSAHQPQPGKGPDSPSPFHTPMSLTSVAGIFSRNVATLLSGVDSQIVDSVTEAELWPRRSESLAE